MATPINRTVKRETATVYRNRPLMIELHPRGVILRPKGTRQKVSIDYRTILDVGYKLLARATAEEKRKVKKESKRGKR